MEPQARKEHERLLRDIQRYGDPEERLMATAILTGLRFTVLRRDVLTTPTWSRQVAKES